MCSDDSRAARARCAGSASSVTRYWPSERAPTIAAAVSTPATQPARRIALNTVIFSIATGLSRIAGLIREVVASSYFGTSGPFSAFTIAFQVPNLIRALVADSALSAAFVPVFTELLEKRKQKEAFQLAGALFGLILVALGLITLVFIAIAPIVIPPITGDQFTSEL